MKQNMMMKDIARRADVSTTTVSNVIHGRREKVSAATYDKIARMLQEYDYQPSIRASLLAGRKGLLVAVLDFRKKEEERLSEQSYCHIRTLIEEMHADGKYVLVYFPKTLEEGIGYVKCWAVDEVVTLGISGKEEQQIAEACACRILKENIRKEKE